MSYISEEKKKEILEKSSLENILAQYHDLSKKKGASFVATCPICLTENKLEYSKSKGVVKCFKCDIGVKTPINYLQKFHNKSFPEALEELARLEMIDLEDKKQNNTERRKQNTFCEKMLLASGLTIDDITDPNIIVDENTKREVVLYEAASLDEAFEKIPGDDVIINYYDLEGKPMTYYRTNKTGTTIGKKKDFFRIRYQNPALHQDKNGKPVKYRSPYGSGSKIYINKHIRNKYLSGAKITTLYVQEGEKKADKASKHGLPSVGVMGIHNIAYNKRLPAEFELIIKRCQVENVVFVVDADWKDLANKIDSKHSADQRPRSFFTAIKNFRDHFAAFANNDIYLKIYWAYVKDNNEKDKGVDDLLANTLKGKEDKLAEFCKEGLLNPDGNGTYLQFENITTMSDFKLLEHWGLQNIESFLNKYKEELKQFPEFMFGKIKWRINEKGICELAQPLLDHEQYWNVEEKKTTDGSVYKTNYNFNHKRCYNFLQNRGYYRLEQPANTYIWINVTGNLVKQVQVHQIRDFVINFTKQINKEDVENMLYRGGPRYFGPDSLSHLEYTGLNLHESKKGLQYLYFNAEFWKITADGIEASEIQNLDGQVWVEKVKDFTPKKLPLLLSEVHQIDAADVAQNEDLKPYIGEWSVEFSEDGDKCHFLQFLLNTSNFYHKNKKFEQFSITEKMETTRHLLSKITAMGYLLHRYRDSGVLKAVIAMDGSMSEVGTSNGRSGKSLIGEALRRLIPIAYINGKMKDLTENKFIWEEVNDRTESAWIDDLRPNIDFERFFPEITGDFQVEPKGMKRYTLPRHCAPKLFLTTNHAVRGEGGSFKDRQFLIGFSDWYNDNYKPLDDFGVLFFDEWSESQWNLFYNFAAMALHLYFKHGLIAAPTEKLEQRRLRQEIGEVFIDWADEYFSFSDNLNVEIYKNVIYDEKSITHGDGFLIKYPGERRYINIRKFKRKLRMYCKFRTGFEFNPSNNGGDIKKNGKEFVEVVVPDELYLKIKAAETSRSF